MTEKPLQWKQQADVVLPPEPTDIRVYQNGTMVVTITGDGRIVYGSGVTPSEAARAFWEAVGQTARMCWEAVEQAAREEL